MSARRIDVASIAGGVIRTFAELIMISFTVFVAILGAGWIIGVIR